MVAGEPVTADRPRVALLQPFAPAIVERIRALTEPDGFSLDTVADAGPVARRAALATADYAVVVSVALDAADLDHAPRLRLVHKWGAGVDNIPLDALRARRIPVLRTAAINAPYVAEHALALILAVLRNVAAADRSMREGRWTGSDHWLSSRSLHGRTVGLVGFGATAIATARLLAPFGCPILYAARSARPPEVERALGARHVPLPDLLGSSDVVSLHVPLTTETRHLIGADALAAMRPMAILVNLYRGDVVDEAALVDALRAGRIAGAGLDVFAREPLAADHPLTRLPNVVLTPHVGGKVEENLTATVGHVTGNLRRHMAGEPLPVADVVNEG
jgi:phosphoglycerate dehydrogenase-like enzyme